MYTEVLANAFEMATAIYSRLHSDLDTALPVTIFARCEL